jgi:predicted RNA-binding Zn ribbon-like protein
MVAAQLVNLLTPGEAHGREYQPPAAPGLPAAVTTALRISSPRRPDLTDEDAAAFAPVARSLRAVFEAAAAGHTDRTAGLINDLLARTGARPWLARHDDEPWHLHYHGSDASVAGGWAASCATGLAVVLGNSLDSRLGVCTAPRCDRVYVDTSRNATRRFCSTTCQNRVKAAAFRAKAG